MKRNLILILMLVLVCSCSSFKPDEEVLKKVTEDGKFIYEYDRACWVATDSVMALNPNTDEMGVYLAQRVDGFWKVAFGKLSDDKKEFLIKYEVTLDSNKNCKIRDFIPPKPDSGFYYKASMAIEASLSNFDYAISGWTYNIVAQPINPDTLRVYFMPAQKETDVFPLGGDGYFDVETKDFTIVNKVRMHKSILQFGTEMENGKIIEYSVSTAILTKIPTPTDVFLVLTREADIYHMVLAGDWVFMINKFGYILNMKKDIFLNAGK